MRLAILSRLEEEALDALWPGSGPLLAPPPRVLGCGSRFLTRDCLPVVRWLLKDYPPGTVVIHGEGPGEPGADELFGQVAEELGFRVERYPPQLGGNGRWRSKSEGILRNTRQLAEGRPTEFLALHTDPKLGTGTRDMVGRLRAASVPGRIILLSSARGTPGSPATASQSPTVVRDHPVLPFLRAGPRPAAQARLL